MKLKNLDTSSFSNFFVSFYREFSEKAVVFLYKLKHIYSIGKEKTFNYIKYQYITYEVKKKSAWLLKTSLDTLITGAIIWIIVHYLDTVPGYGLLAYIITHYIQWFVEIIKRK